MPSVPQMTRRCDARGIGGAADQFRIDDARGVARRGHLPCGRNARASNAITAGINTSLPGGGGRMHSKRNANRACVMTAA